MLALVQAFDPPGVAARTIQECLLIQLKSDPNPDPVSVEIVEEHFDELSRRRYPDIARALKLSLDRIMESVEEIMGLEPKPGRRFGGSDSRYIVPDVVVHKMGGEYVVVLNEDGIPRLRVNSLYRSLLRTRRRARPASTWSRSSARRCGSSRAWTSASGRCARSPSRS